MIGSAVFLSPASISARLTPLWPYQRLFAEADLIVIAEARFSEKTADPWPRSGPLELKYVGVNTTFEVLHVLKGKKGLSKIRFLHFNLAEAVRKSAPGEIIVTSPGASLVDFRGREVTIRGTRLTMPSPQYLLFLRKLPDGRYEPLSGQYDAQLSVRELFKPLPKKLGGSARSDADRFEE